MKSKLEECIKRTLGRHQVNADYEGVTVPVVLTLQTKPDFWLPERGIVVEAKGVLRNEFEFKKLVNTADVFKAGFTYANVIYTGYIVAVLVNEADFKQYTGALGNIDRLVRTTQRGNYPLAGIRMIAALRRANVNAVPVTYSCQTVLLNAINTTSHRMVKIK